MRDAEQRTRDAHRPKCPISLSRIELTIVRSPLSTSDSEHGRTCSEVKSAMELADASDGAGVRKTSEPPDVVRGMKDDASGFSMPLPLRSPMPLPALGRCRGWVKTRTFNACST